MLESYNAMFSSDNIVWYSDKFSVISFSIDDLSYKKNGLAIKHNARDTLRC